MARARGIELRAESAGLEPDVRVPEAVVAGLSGDGIDVREYRPGLASPERLAAATCVVSFGCELPADVAAGRVEQWDDMPLVSDGFDQAREAIVGRVERMIERFR